MGKSICAASKMSNQATSSDLLSAISSPELEDGPTRFDSQDGPQTDLFGREVVRANPSARQENKKGSATSDTSGQNSSGSLGSVGHQLSSANKSQVPSEERILKTRICRRCGEEKSYSEFYTNSKGNRPAVCMECARARERGYKREKPEVMSRRYQEWRDKKRGYALVNVARHRAKQRGIPFNLDPADIQARIDRGYCEVTGIPFDLTKPRCWNAPSLDQIEPSRGYTQENVRVILFSLNVMMNVWGEQKVVQIGNAILKQRTKRSEELTERLTDALKRRLDGAGSTLFETTWKEKVTPSGHKYWEHTASARRTGGNGFTSLPTPNSADNNASRSDNAPAYSERWMARENHGAQLAHTVQALSAVPTPNAMEGGQTNRGGKRYDEKLMGGIAKLASCPTPMAGTPAQNGYNEAGNTDYSRKILELATCATPRSEDSECAGAHRGIADGLHSQAQLSTVSTPNGDDANNGTRKSGVFKSLTREATLSAVSTPAARDYRSESATDEYNEKRWTHKRGKPLNAQATLASISTPSSRDWKDSPGMNESGVDPDGSHRMRLDQLPQQAQLAGSGETATGGGAETGSTGQLNPDYSRWLQGFPAVWGSCAAMATQSVSRSRKRSLGLILK